MERRKEPRVVKKLLVNLDKEGYEGMGLTANISKKGMFIATTEILPIDSEVSILVGIADETYTLKGRVMWVKEWPDGDAPSEDVQSAMGVEILEAPSQYTEYVENMLSQ
jgi:Tfp pilus assembly protein PilZ